MTEIINNKSYKKFDNEQAQPQVAETSIFQTPGSSSINFNSNTVFDSEKISPIDFKERSRKKLLTWIQLGASIFILLLECISTGLSSRSYWGFGAEVCHAGTGVWIGSIGILTGIVGILWIRKTDSNAPTKKKFMTIYFVLSIIVAVFDGILIVLASVCMTQATAYVKYAKANQQNWSYLVIRDAHLVVIAMNVLMVLTAIIHITANVLAAVLICRSYWMSGEKKSTMTVIYVDSNLSTSQMPKLCIENGSRVTFLPVNSPATGDAMTNGHA